MVAYKSKLIRVEDDTLNFSPIRYNSDSYPREDNKCGGYYSVVFTYDGHLWDTFISENTYIRNNIIPEIRDSVLSSLHIGDQNIGSTQSKQILT